MRTPPLGGRRSGLIVVAGSIAAALALAMAGVLPGCAPQGQATAAQVLKVACPWDQAMQPVAVAVVGAMGPAGATAAAIDKLAAHPFVASLCAGGPASVTPATAADMAGGAAQVTIDLTTTKAAQ